MNEDMDSDDSPFVSDIRLTTINCPYQCVIKALLDETIIDTEIIYQAFIDIIHSEDSEKSSVLDYLLSSTVPS